MSDSPRDEQAKLILALLAIFLFAIIFGAVMLYHEIEHDDWRCAFHECPVIELKKR